MTALDAETGEVKKEARLPLAGGEYFASPVAADGKIFLASHEGKVSVLKASREWEVLATNDLHEPIAASPALADNAVFVRTQSRLYCFRELRARTLASAAPYAFSSQRWGPGSPSPSSFQASIITKGGAGEASGRTVAFDSAQVIASWTSSRDLLRPSAIPGQGTRGRFGLSPWAWIPAVHGHGDEG